jgi:hypothetical protein
MDLEGMREGAKEEGLEQGPGQERLNPIDSLKLWYDSFEEARRVSVNPGDNPW